MNNSKWLAGVLLALSVVSSFRASAADSPDSLAKYWIDKGWAFFAGSRRKGNKPETVWFYNGLRLRERPDKYSIWIIGVAVDGSFPPDKPGYPPFSAQRRLLWINCGERSFTIRGNAEYSDPRGEDLLAQPGFSVPTSQPPEYIEPVPNTIPEEVVLVACHSAAAAQK
jgi:hypothetical protein